MGSSVPFFLHFLHSIFNLLATALRWFVADLILGLLYVVDTWVVLIVIYAGGDGNLRFPSCFQQQTEYKEPKGEFF